MKRVCVIGGGPAGMMAAYSAAAKGNNVKLFEKNEKLGKKLYLTGKGRCNITNASPIEDFFNNVVTNRPFLYSAFYTFSNINLLEFLSQYGLKTKTERGGRVFPVTDKSSDVIKALSKSLISSGVKLSLNSKITDIVIKNGSVQGIVSNGIVSNGKEEPFESIIIATGGLSYPSTGSTGDGYEFARKAGHKIKKASASLIALETKEDVRTLAGLTLKNIGFSLNKNGKSIYKDQGELLFTHTGVSGPLALTASAYMNDNESYEVLIDLKPALDYKKLDSRLLRDFDEKHNKDFINVLNGLMPSKLTSSIAAIVGIGPEKKAHSITKDERNRLLKTLKSLEFKIESKRPIEEAVITRGGIDVKEVDASTMQSKIIKGLYFAGEIIDVDALTGGYNLQIAFSTGFLAGSSC